MKTIIYIILALIPVSLSAQNTDTLKNQSLPEVNIRVVRQNISKLPETEHAFLWSGKKSEVISLQQLDANIAEKTPRQVFSKVPGVFVYDMDGSGNQTNISTRGLDPHRGWEFNIRANGIMTNTDIYGYPASHFSLPFEALGRIELVRGTGALQYGAQFGGMLNYIIKKPDTTRLASFETTNSVGSYGLVSNYLAAGGKYKKLEYYAYFNRRVSQGYRDNGASDFDGEGLVLNYHANKNLVLNATLLRSRYLYQLPGQLTDNMFEENPRQSTRSRNYYSPEIWVPSLALNWKISSHTLLRWTASAIYGQRSSVMFDRPANVPDTIQAGTLQYSPRNVDIDNYHSRTTELRLLHDYTLWGQNSLFSAGIQYINNDLHRRQQGKGSTGTDYDLSINEAGWGRDMHLKSSNIALFVENKFQLSDRLSISPGLRYEYGVSRFTGTTTYYDPEDLKNEIVHNFPLFGLNGEFSTGRDQSLYAGVSQAYRPVIFKDIVPGTIYERSDKNLKDAYGYNAELGWRGKIETFKWDVSAFMLQYNRRLGSLAQYDNTADTFLVFRTNIGNSLTKGLELFLEYDFSLTEDLRMNIFTSSAFFDARYQGDSLRVSQSENRSIKGKKVESVPDVISRNGLNIRFRAFSTSLLYSYTASSFSDPQNTVTPSASGAVGKVPAYGLWDINAAYRLQKIVLRMSLNNIFDKQYFTKRPTFYPGPGIWPSDGRSIVFSVSLKF